MSEPQDPAARVDAAASGVAGVARVYAAAPVVVGLVRSVVAADAALSVVRAGDPPEVLVSIGVDAAEAGHAVALRVADAVRAELGASAVVHVRVSRIHVSSDAGRAGVTPSGSTARERPAPAASSSDAVVSPSS